MLYCIFVVTLKEEKSHIIYISCTVYLFILYVYENVYIISCSLERTQYIKRPKLYNRLRTCI